MSWHLQKAKSETKHESKQAHDSEKVNSSLVFNDQSSCKISDYLRRHIPGPEVPKVKPFCLFSGAFRHIFTLRHPNEGRAKPREDYWAHLNDFYHWFSGEKLVPFALNGSGIILYVVIPRWQYLCGDHNTKQNWPSHDHLFEPKFLDKCWSDKAAKHWAKIQSALE